MVQLTYLRQQLHSSKDKALIVQQAVEAPKFQDNRHKKVVSLLAIRNYRLPPFSPSPFPKKYSWYWFFLKAESTSEPECGRKDYVIDTNGNRTRDLADCSTMPQPTAPPLAPTPYYYRIKRERHFGHFPLSQARSPPHNISKNVSVNEIWDFLEFYTAYSGNSVPTFRDNLSVHFQGSINPIIMTRVFLSFFRRKGKKQNLQFWNVSITRAVWTFCIPIWKSFSKLCGIFSLTRWKAPKRLVTSDATHLSQKPSKINPYPTAFPWGNGMVLHFYQQQESSTTKTVHKVINKGLKAYV